MAALPDGSLPRPAPKVPGHAWTWLQRSRTVLAEIASQLYGEERDGVALERLKEDYDADPFVQDLVARVVCDQAFNGRVPERRPAGARWDRGLTWWAAHLAGVTVRDFDARSTGPEPPQARLFGPQPEPAPAPQPAASTGTDVPRRRRLASIERRAMVNALKDLLASGDGQNVSAQAVKALIASLEDDDS